MPRLRLSTAQGLYQVATGVWPLVHYRSFESVTGPKADPWLVQTVAGLCVTAGWAMVRAGSGAEGQAAARRLGVGSALTFGTIDAVYGGGGRIRRIYLVDAAVQAGWLVAWGAHAARRRRAAAGAIPGGADPGVR